MVRIEQSSDLSLVPSKFHLKKTSFSFVFYQIFHYRFLLRTVINHFLKIVEDLLLPCFF